MMKATAMTRSIPGGGFPKCSLRSSARCGRKNVAVVRASGASFEVELLPKGSAGKAMQLTADSTVVGSEATAGLQVPVEGVVAEHAKLMKRNGRLFCTALVGDGDMMADTKTWLNANQLRSGVEYIVPAGGELAFGLEDETWTAKFEEAEVDDTMAKMMMKAMAAGASDEVKKAVQDATE